MLGMNGFELAKEVRYSALPDGKTIPLILLVSDEDVKTLKTSVILDRRRF